MRFQQVLANGAAAMFLAAALVAVGAELLPSEPERHESTATMQGQAAPRIEFVYFGAEECGYCRRWETTDLPILKTSPTFRQVRFNRVEMSVTSGIPAASQFPPEIRHLHDSIATRLNGAGAPMYAVLSDGKVVSAWRGAAKRPDEILALLNAALLAEGES